jgi:hypothetical protein
VDCEVSGIQPLYKDFMVAAFGINNAAGYRLKNLGKVGLYSTSET